MNSKSLPLLAGLLVLGLAVLLLVGKGMFESDGSTPAANDTPQRPQIEEVPLHAKQVEARLAIREGRTDDARAALESVAEADPAYTRVQLDLAVLEDGTGNAAAAMAAAGRVLDVDPENPEGHHVLCRAYMMQEDWETAERHCLRSLEIAQANPQARYSIAFLRLVSGHVDRSIDSYLRAMAYGSEQSHIDAALADLTKLEQDQPENGDVHYVMAFFANSLGAEDQEILELERYLESVPEGDVADAARARLAELKAN